MTAKELIERLSTMDGLSEVFVAWPRVGEVCTTYERVIDVTTMGDTPTLWPDRAFDWPSCCPYHRRGGNPTSSCGGDVSSTLNARDKIGRSSTRS